MQDFDQVARQTDKKWCRLDIAAEPRRARVEKNHEIDVAGEIKLAGSHLAHRQHNVSRTALRIFLIRDLQLFALHCRAEEMIDSEADRRIGDAGERLGNVRQFPNASNVGERDQERGFCLHVAEYPHQFGLRPC